MSSLIEDQINSDEEGMVNQFEGKTEDLSSMIQSDVIEARSSEINPLDMVSASPGKKFPEPPSLSKSSSRREAPAAPEPIAAAADRSEASKTVRVVTKQQKVLLGAGIGLGVLLIEA
ncbi:MAG: hypothetical protein R2877_00750 [Bdellovibrionota bacterium]